MIGVALLVFGLVAILGVYYSQNVLNEHARNLTLAQNDAGRVLERIREQNVGCSSPSASAPTGFASWDAWLADASDVGGGGKSIQPDPTTNELVVITTSGTDPIHVTVAVCWRHRERTIGECAWSEATGLSADESITMPSDTDAIDSPAMLATAMTCRSS